MIELKRVLACGVLLLSSSFGAQAAETTYVFASLTGIQDDGTKLSLTGVLVSTTTPTTLALGPVPDRCVNLSLAMLSNPGTYNLTVVTDTEPDPFTGVPITSFAHCRLDLGPLFLRSGRQ
jgi:hypothetical protein